MQHFLRMATVVASLYIILSVALGVTFSLTIASLHLVLIPLLFKYCKTFQRQIVFLNYVQWPISPDFSDPRKSGMEGARNLSIEHRSHLSGRNIKLGIWHVLPRSSYERCKSELERADRESTDAAVFQRELVAAQRPIILYCHGNANHRAAHHRVKLYQVLQKMDVHVIAFDYRGYGDSSTVRPCEPGAVEDALVVYDWLLSSIDKSEHPPPVYVWGHSLGSGVTSHLMGNLEELSAQVLGRSLPHPAGLILESAFNNLRDVVDNHFMTVFVRWLPYYETTFIAPFSGCREYEFTSSQHLSRASTLPTLLLHARGDYVIPRGLGVKLYEAISATRGPADAPVRLHTYCSSLNLGHTWICNAPDLPQVLSEFLSRTMTDASNRT